MSDVRDSLAARKTKSAPYAEKGATIYRGDGEGVRTPFGLSIAGIGKYSAMSRNDAQKYGGKITTSTVDLQNPIIIESDQDWRALTRASGWEFPNPSGQGEASMRKQTADLKSEVMRRGHDGIIVRFDSISAHEIRLLRTVFDIPQVVDYGVKLAPDDPMMMLPDGREMRLSAALDDIEAGERAAARLSLCGMGGPK